MKNQNDDYEHVGYSLRKDTWLDWLPKLPRPIIAFGKIDLYSILMHGKGFALPIEGSEDPAIGFYTTTFVAAENIHEAEKAAYERVQINWKKKGYLKSCGREPALSTEKVKMLGERFRIRTETGFIFYDNEDTN